MARGKLTFRQSDLVRALKAAQAARAAGCEIGRVDIDPSGRISVIIGEGGESAVAANEWDEVLCGADQTPVR